MSTVEWLYGRNVVRAALGAGSRRRAHKLAATPPALDAVADLVPEDLPVDTVSPHQLDELLGTREHQGVALQVDGYPYADADRLLRADVLVVLDEVTDPHNLGAVARTALAAGAGGLVVPRHRSAHVTPAAVKASAGTLEYLPVAQVTNVVTFLRRARDAGFWIYGAAGEASASYLQTDLTGRIVLVAGAEGRGLRPLVARTCDALLSIPMEPPVESLNVSVAAALLLYEARRQREAAARAGGRRVSDTLYIVDGYNVLHALFRGAEKEEIFARRDWLADRLASFAALRGARAVLVFDGSGPRSTSSEPIKGAPVEVVFAGGRFTADTLIARRIAEQPADVQIVVVSADQEVQRAASRAGVSRMTPRELGAELTGGEESRQALDSASDSTRMPSRLEDKVDPETLRRLEEMRHKPQ